MAKRKESRIYWRERGGVRRAYADFRDYAAEGGGQEALIPPGCTTATTDADIAQALVTKRLEELQGRRLNKVVLGIERHAGLKAFAAFHLREKAAAGRVVDDYLEQVQKHLERAVRFFGAARDLNAVRVSDVREWTAHLRRRPNGRGQRCPTCDARGELAAAEPVATCPQEGCESSWRVGTLSDKTVRDHLNSLSNLYRRAASEGYVPPGFNPVGAMMEKPQPARREADWFEVDEAALLLESARLYEPPKDKHGIPFMHPLLATALLTGARKSELLGLAVEDVSFDRNTVTFRPHPWRRLKTRSAHRSVPLWPQAEALLREYIFGGPGPKSGLLFPSPRTGRMVTDCRKALDAIGKRAGWPAGEVRWHRCRHSYCAARLQTLDNGAPVSEYTVSRELGHGGVSLVRRIYGHLGTVRHRSEVVEYRVEQHRKVLAERLEALKAAV